jgi:hypothetical protein
MCIDFRPLGRIAINDLFGGRLKAYGTEHWNYEGQRCLYDSTNYVHVYERDRAVGSFTRFMGNNAHYIITSISEAFGMRIVSEHEPEFWGFETQAEWDACWDAMHQKYLDDFYAAAIRVEPNGIGSDMRDYILTAIEKVLMGAEPELSHPNMREELIMRAAERCRRALPELNGDVPF